MDYISTRGGAKPHSFEEVLLGGLAPDGGLFVPQAWPQIQPPSRQTRYQDVVFPILSRFADGAFSDTDLRADVENAYAEFDCAEVAPLSQLSDNTFLLELFHGPTLAFKDIAMQLLGRLLAQALARRDMHATVLVATSGDTGSAAIAALGGVPGIELFVLHPLGRVSEVQRRQMTTTIHTNVHNVALEGSFDDAQRIVKELFADRDFAARQRLAAVNSINFVRVAAQCVYYFTAAARFDRPPIFVVPTGNFGDVFAGEAAMHMGLEIERLIVATNANDILYRALHEGHYAAGPAQHTLSPSMDIQVASNFERALFEASNRDASWVGEAMAGFAADKRLGIPTPVLQILQQRYAAERCDDTETLQTISRVHAEAGRLIDPHTAVGVAAARKLSDSQAPIIVLSTAHPAKFPEAVRRATGLVPPLPPRLAALYEGEERMSVLPNDTQAVRTLIEQLSGRR